MFHSSDFQTRQSPTTPAVHSTTLLRERFFALRPFILVVLLVEYWFVVYLLERQTHSEIVYPWMAAQLSLLALLIVFGLRSGIARAQAFLVGVGALALANSFWPERWRCFPYQVEAPGVLIKMTLLLLFQTACACIPLLFAITTGVVSFLKPHKSRPPPSSSRARGQFSLMQLMASTTCLAFVFAIASYDRPRDWSDTLSQWFFLAPPVAALAVAALATFCLLLGDGRVLHRLGVFMVMTGLAWLPGLWMYLFARYHLYLLSEWTEMLAGQTVLLVPVLLVMRLLGYRLRFHRPRVPSS